jgi:hypothetical protein
MVTAQDCLKKYGPAHLEKAMVLWDVPSALEIGVIPKRIYCNRDLVQPLEHAFRRLISTGQVNHLKTWDGCFNIRNKRGGRSTSLHAWGIAIDVNAAWNGFGRPPQLPQAFIQCFTHSGFDWGGTWAKPDGMHFQLSQL